jgi:hypothetical protein
MLNFALMKWVFSILVFLTMNVIFAQDKFLELSIEPKTQDEKSLRKFSVMVVTTDGAIFEIQTKRKKSTFFLPAGEFYKLKVIKEGYYKSHIEIDLKEVQSANSKSETLPLEPKMISSEEPQENTLRKYKYEPRYAKMIRVFNEE